MVPQIINVMNKYLVLATLLLLSLFWLESCYYDKEQELYKYMQAGCDTSAVAYSNQVSRILTNNCTSCHGGSSPSAGIALDYYAGVKATVNNGTLMGSINQLSGYSPMPKGGSKLNPCDIRIFEIWINSGAPNN